jgi:hypothetical protein
MERKLVLIAANYIHADCACNKVLFLHGEAYWQSNLLLFYMVVF